MAKRKQPYDDLEFEIHFFEQLVDRYPDFLEPLIQLGSAYTQTKRYNDGLRIDRRLTKLQPRDPIIWYNLACSYALLEQCPSATRALKKAIQLGYDDWDFLERDPDLAPLRRTPGFQHFIAKARAQQA
jgi:tetratricopeptide (TPR) repeat protein